jgi:hypothetical protein
MKLKKYGADKIESLDPASPKPLDQFVYRTVFGEDFGRLSYFREQVKAGNAQADTLYTGLFPSYTCNRRVYTWRFTSTKFENLHWDNFGIAEPFQQVRIFTNISSSPRLWRTSHRIYDFAQPLYSEHRMERFAHKPGDDLNFFVNNKVLGGMKAPCLDRLPKHHIAFEQGDVWLCETRIVAHQIYYGDKAFAAMYFSDPQTMERPELHFDACISRLHLSHGSASASSELSRNSQ